MLNKNKADLTGYSKITSGTYTGNGTQNRAIPHGLGGKPKYVQISDVSSFVKNTMIYDMTTILWTYPGGSDGGAVTVTDANTTNFYVGNAVTFHANENARTFNWVAFS